MKLALTKAELVWLESALNPPPLTDIADWAVEHHKCQTSIHSKVSSALRPQAPTLATSAGILEKTMQSASRGKVVSLSTPSGYATAYRMAARLGVTVEDCSIVGRWLSMQGWLGPQTLIDVLRKWDTWLPKARAQAMPKGVPEGFDGEDAKPGTTGQCLSTEGRRKPTL